MGAESRPKAELVLRVGGEELVIRRRYEAASIANDALIALWFIVGSVMFFFTAWEYWGTWCFLVGSVELLIRPVIRMSRHVHVQGVRARTASGEQASAASPESSQDF